MLRRLHMEMVEESDRKLERKQSKRQRIVQFFRWKKQKPQSHDEVPVRPLAPSPPSEHPHSAFSIRRLMASLPSKRSTAAVKTTPPKPLPGSNAAEVTTLDRPSTPVDTAGGPPVEQVEQVPLSESPLETKEEEKIEVLNEAQIHTLFAGAPHFSLKEANGHVTATTVYPWDSEGSTKDVSDSVQLVEPAFLAATVHQPSPKAQRPSDKGRNYQGYDVDVVEVPSMLSAQGIEPGSIGYSHFLELPRSDSLVTDSEQSQSSKHYLEATRNKELMQSNPERIGIRSVEMDLVYDRLAEFQDLYEAFKDSPGPMTILNNQGSGDLYANLFTKFLTPPGYDGSSDDPTGLQIQITALLRVLRLKGVWYDFSLVEFRIRLGQLLWSDPEPIAEHESHPLWTDREILLLQITLACELLLRLDALTIVDAHDKESQISVAPEDVRSFLELKTRKIDWDLVLARRFLDNILVVKGSDAESLTQQPKSRGLLSLLGVSPHAESPKTDIILLPQYQTRQLSGLSRFAETLQWPNIELFSRDLSQTLGLQDSSEQTGQRPSSSGKLLDITTPSSISVYATPMQTPRSANHVSDSYFGHVGKPALSRHNSRSLRVPLSPSVPTEDKSVSAINDIGGWLSRSYLTGLVLPGEAISHFLISTLLENDKFAIAKLGDSANLYGGFSYANRSWWSTKSIVGRVLACLDGSAECMGWISCPKLPQGPTDCWHSIHSEQLPYEDRLRTTATSDLIVQESAVAPENMLTSVKSEDFVLPSDSEILPAHSIALTSWELTPLNPDLMDTDSLSSPPSESDIHVPSITFNYPDQSASHAFTLAYDVQFITSWPCTTPASAPVRPINRPYILRRSLTETLSRSSSKRSETLGRRNSHGFEPLLSHPPDSTDIAPKRMYSPDSEDGVDTSSPTGKPLNAHLLHKSYPYKIVSATDVLGPDFVLPFATYTSRSATRLHSSPHGHEIEPDVSPNNKRAILVLDARGSSDLQLLARAWCAEQGFHAIIGKVERTCLACCIREARGLGLNVVIRV
ncbi:Nn.00g093300.m01.CDS01 [Neocucurbitaria sp. VM-36]